MSQAPSVAWPVAIALLGQSLMHQIGIHYLPPLHVALGTELHTITGSQLMIDMFSKFGVCSSSDQVRLFERAAAVQKTALDQDSLEMETISPLYSGDNVDVNKITLVGTGTFHGMAIIFSHISKSPLLSQSISRRKVSKDEILKKSISIKTKGPLCWRLNCS